MSNGWLGKSHSQETKDRLSAINAGKNVGGSFEGKTHSETSRQQISDSLKKSGAGGCSKDPAKEAERRRKLSESAKARRAGGYIEGSGRGRKGRYQGYWCDSSYELAWVVYQLEHGVQFSRNTEKFPYEFNGKTQNWIPDFILADGSYVEIKGYETEQSRAKLRDFPHPIMLLKEKNLGEVFEYVIAKYGKDYIKLYGR